MRFGATAPFHGPVRLAGFRPVPYRPHRVAGPADQPTTQPERKTTLYTTGEKTAIVSGLIVGTGVTALITYYGIRAGLQEEGFLALLGWVFGLPAAVSAGVGLFTLGAITFAGFPETSTI